MAGLGYPRIDLVARQLAAFTGLRALRHLDLQIVGVDQIFAGHAEASGCDLLDRAAAQVAIGVARKALWILATFAGVGASADAVHRDREGLVGFRAYRAIGHRAAGEALHNGIDGLDFAERNRCGRLLEAEQAAQGRVVLALVVDQTRVLLENLVLAGARRVLQLIHRVRIEQVVLAVTPPLVFAAPGQVGLLHHALWISVVMAHGDFLFDDVEPDAADARSSPGEIALNEGLVETDGFEDLRAAIGLHG